MTGDHLADFLDTATIRDRSAWVSNAELWHAYRNWCAARGHLPVSRIEFKLRLEEVGYQQGNRRSRGGRYWCALGLVAE